MVRLNNNNLYDFFSTATADDSVTVVGKKLFDLVDRQSNTLVVTIGDSWTWGADLTQLQKVGIHLDRLTDDNYRQQCMYGNVLANQIGADFLGLGESGSGNWYIDKKLKELSTICDKLPYDKIIVISIFTEVGRDFNSHNDVTIDYRSWLLNNIKGAGDYYKFLGYVNHVISRSIANTLAMFDSRYKFMFATNFVDPIGYELLKDWFLPQSWLEIICQKNQISYRPDQCYLVFPWVIEKFHSVFDLAPELDRVEWLKWTNEITDHANIRAKVCAQDNLNFGKLLHPLAPNHRAWAEYLYRNLHG